MLSQFVHTSTLAQLQKSKFIIIRHAESTYNRAYIDNVLESPLLGEFTEAELALKCATDRGLFDAPLSERGREQCQGAQPVVDSLPNISVVYVSPLRRAIETAYLLFAQS